MKDVGWDGGKRGHNCYDMEDNRDEMMNDQKGGKDKEEKACFSPPMSCNWIAIASLGGAEIPDHS